MKTKNTHRSPIIAKNGETSSKAEIAEFQACALAMQTGTPTQAAIAFEKIYNRYKEWLRFIILRSLNLNSAEAEDILQDVFVKVYRNIHKYSADYALSTWLHKITLNTIIDHKRKSNVEVLSIEGLQKDFNSSNDDGSSGSAGEAVFQIKDESADTHKVYVNSERKELVHKAIATVISSEKEKVVINLFFMQGLSQEEIHVETKLPVNTIKALLFRAKDKLKAFLIAESPDLLLMNRFYNKNLKVSN